MNRGSSLVLERPNYPEFLVGIKEASVDWSSLNEEKVARRRFLGGYQGVAKVRALNVDFLS